MMHSLSEELAPRVPLWHAIFGAQRGFDAQSKCYMPYALLLKSHFEPKGEQCTFCLRRLRRKVSAFSEVLFFFFS
jgi:hypothetical protein